MLGTNKYCFTNVWSLLRFFVWWRGTPCWFPLDNSEIIQAVAHFSVFSNILLETFVPNLVSLTNPRSSYIGQNSNCHNSRTSNDIGMKLGQLTKHDKKNTATPKKLMTSCQQIVTSLSLFRFMANLEQ